MRAVLGDGADVKAEARPLQEEPDRRRNHDDEDDHRHARLRQHQPVRQLDAAREPVGVGDRDVLRAEDQADRLDETRLIPQVASSVSSGRP